MSISENRVEFIEQNYRNFIIFIISSTDGVSLKKLT